VPISPTETKIIAMFYRKNECTEAEIDSQLGVGSFTVFEEDTRVCNEVQKGLATGRVNLDGGPLHPERERGVAYFDSLVRAALEAPPQPALAACAATRKELEY